MAWMPTLSADVQAVLATDKVRFQGQEVAFVIADDHYSARDALELIDVDYEPLPVVVDAARAALDAPDPRRQVRAGRQPRLRLGGGRRRGHRGRRSRAPTSSSSRTCCFPRSHPAPMETCGAVAAFDRVDGKLTLWCTTQAPHAHRTLYSLITGLPEHKIRVISPDVGGGFGNKVPVYPGYVCALAGAMLLGPARQVGRGPLREPDVDRVRARLRDARAGSRPPRDGRIQAVDVDVIADHGAFNAAAQPIALSRPASSRVFTGSYDVEAAHCRVTGAYTNKAPGGVAYACSFRIAEAVYLVERLRRLPGARAGHRPGRAAAAQPAAARAVPVRVARPAGSTTRATTSARCDQALELAGYDELRRGAGARSARAAS